MAAVEHREPCVNISGICQAPEPQDTFERELKGFGDQLDVGGKREGDAEEGAEFPSLDSHVDGEAFTMARNAGLQVILKNINHHAVPGSPSGLLSYVRLFALLFNFLASLS